MTIDKSNRNWPPAIFQLRITFSSFINMSKHVWRAHKKKSFTFEKANDLVFYFNDGKNCPRPGLPLPVTLPAGRLHPTG